MFKQSLKRLLGSAGTQTSAGEKPANYYDQMYANSEEYCKPFWQSRY